MGRGVGCSRQAGFTLIELLVVAVLVGVITTVVIPQFSTTTVSDTREKATQGNLHALKMAIDLYTVQHGGVYPAVVGTGTAAAYSQAAFVDQLTKYSNAAGQVSAEKNAAYPMGPYLRAIPVESVSNDKTVTVSTSSALSAAPSGNSGWFYVAKTGTIMRNVAAPGSAGAPILLVD